MGDHTDIRLRHLLDHQQAMVRYSDTKNAAIVAFAGSSIFIFTRIPTFLSYFEEHSLLIYAGIVLASCAALFGVGSFIPRLSTFDNRSKGIVFFSDLADGISFEDFLEAVKGESSCERLSYEASIAHQIVEISRIAKFKMECSTWGFRALFCSAALLFLFGIGGVVNEALGYFGN